VTTITTKAIFEAVIRVLGLDPEAVTFGDGYKAKLIELVNDAVKSGYRAEWWPETMAVERRQYRPTWDAAVTYAEDDEVYYEDGDGDGNYYISLQGSNLNKQPDTQTAYWEEVGSDFIRSIALAQDDETEIGAVDLENCVFDDDPREPVNKGPIRPVDLLGTDIIVRSEQAPLRPYLRFQGVCPEFTMTAWSGATAYVVDDLVYVASTGKTYVAIAAGTNKDPTTETSYWTAVGFPKFLKDYVKHVVAADLMDADADRYRQRAKAEDEIEKLRAGLVSRQVARRARFSR
jgi:hypothetical protein